MRQSLVVLILAVPLAAGSADPAAKAQAAEIQVVPLPVPNGFQVGMDLGTLSAQPAEKGISAQLVREPVLFQAGGKVGNIETLFVTEDGGVLGAVVDVGEYLGRGQKPVLVPADRLHSTKSTGGLVVEITATKQELLTAPKFRGLPPDRNCPRKM
jgi:hypothetical protein